MSSLYNKCSLVCFCLFISLIGFSQTYVDINNGINGSGNSWADAYDNLEDALDNANAGDELWVAEGIYSLSTANSEFNIPSGVAVYGGFEGDETTRSQRSWQANLTILNGANTAYNVVFIQNGNSNTILDGFTIQNGMANSIGDFTDQRGGGLFIQQTGMNACAPNILNCTFTSNFSINGGGAVYINTASGGTTAPTFTNCTFSNNSSDADGGAIYINASSNGENNSEFTKCTFNNNSTIFSGGAIYNNGNNNGEANMTIKQCDFYSNQANSVAGAIYNSGSNGGQSSPDIFDSRFYNNRGNVAAGAIYNNGTGAGSICNPTITNCTLYGNNADQNGGAIYNNGSSSGICSPVISNCIIYGNTVLNDFNRSFIMRNESATPTIRFSLVDATDCTALTDMNNGTTIVTCGSGMIFNQDPTFVNAAAGNLRIQEPSPAIHAGNSILNSNPEDLDGNPRDVLGIDMGAYEVEESNLPIELGSFNAYLQNNRVTISWITISEINNDYFVVERSGDGINFENLETVQGAGNTTTAHSYQVYDPNPFPGKNYYRLKDVSFAGEVAYSSVRIVETAKRDIKVYPNPSADYIQVNLSKFPVGDAHLYIYNTKGQLMYNQVLKIEEGRRTLTIDAVKSLIPGSYYINISAANAKRWSARFEKIDTQ